jgi:indolepyruvate decarboxylase
MPDTQPTIAAYLIQRLQDLGARHVFGVPGDYVLSFYKLLEDSPLAVINTCDEQGAGFAADAYARFNGLGVCCITYTVGGLKVANTTAQAYAEKSPVVVISGAPGTNERRRNALLHHKVRDFDTQLKVFEQLTVASAVLDNPHTTAREIDRVLAAALPRSPSLAERLPEYIHHHVGHRRGDEVARPVEDDAKGQAHEALRHDAPCQPGQGIAVERGRVPPPVPQPKDQRLDPQRRGHSHQAVQPGL